MMFLEIYNPKAGAAKGLEDQMQKNGLLDILKIKAIIQRILIK
jgi:hypothetical protein